MISAVGQSLWRVDARDKVTGRGVYTGDLKLPGMIYAKPLRSPLAHARIARIDARRAESIPGVITVLTRENLKIAASLYGSYFKDQPVVALEKVCYAGDVVAAVAAVAEGIAEEALKSIDVEYEDMPAVLTVEEALREGAPLVHRNLDRKDPIHGKGGSVLPHKNSNIALHFRYQRGNVEKGLRDADAVFEDIFEFPSAYHYAMEPHASVAVYKQGMLTVWSSTQSPFPLRQELARVFGLPYSCVRVIVPYRGEVTAQRAASRWRPWPGSCRKWPGGP
ncbi:MAG: molybdopterin-dependent oxidoreductase [Candidatus Binatia bacterium]|nr:molybdopterin-dependent oxidoreductase [Candidatus Binatia bacterium]